jgi:hypothetical protein
MWQQCKQKYGHTVFTGVTVVVMSLFAACSFQLPPGIDINTPEGIHAILNSAPYKNLTESQRATYVEVPGLLKVQHGLGCAQASEAASETYIGLRIRDMAVMPPGYNTGTVFLNGWRLEYQNDDHHVRGLGSVIFNITHNITQTQNGTQHELHWEAGGVMSDDNGDDKYNWCYIYTLVFWYRNSSNRTGFWPEIDALPFQVDNNPAPLTFVHSTGGDAGNDTARRALPGAVSLPSALPRAVLPRGFGLSWASDTDHHLLQAGFDLGTPDPSGNTISWTSTTLWKDNNTRRDYYGAELVSVLSGQGVQPLLQPATVLRWSGSLGRWLSQPNTVPLTPNNDPAGFPSTCVGEGEGPETQQEQFSVQNVPFDYALPVLGGWQLEYPCTDHHVKKIGVWLKGFSYVKAPGAATGTLLYTIESTLTDHAIRGIHIGEARYKISILGLNRAGVLPPTATGSTSTSVLLAEPLALSQ